MISTVAAPARSPAAATETGKASVSRPPSAADRAGKSAPAIARMTGKIGPKAKPTTAKSAIDRGRDGTNTAATRAHDATLMHAVANARWSKRSAIRADTRRPSANPPQKSERLVVASVSGAASRNRTSQLETPTSDAT